MQKFVSGFLGIVTSLALVLFVLPGGLASAHSNSGNSAGRGCAHLVVSLHGTSPATSRCLDKTQNPQSVTPFTSVSNCGPGLLRLFQFANFDASDGDICFTGTGFVNMTDFWGPWWDPYNWNDHASSFQTNCAVGVFFSDINGNGAQQAFPTDVANNFDGNNGRLFDNTLSSIRIDKQVC